MDYSLTWDKNNEQIKIIYFLFKRIFYEYNSMNEFVYLTRNLNNKE